METSSIIITIICACLGSTGLFAFIQFLIGRKDKKKDALKDIQQRLIVAEKDSCRTQMLVLMKLYPTEKTEIMKIAKHYFDDLEGDWYLTSIFHSWIKEQGLDEPLWFKKESKND